MIDRFTTKDRDAVIYSLQCQGMSVTPDDDLEAVFASMSVAKQRKCIKLLQEIQRQQEALERELHYYD